MESTHGETGPATRLVPELNSCGVWPGRLVISERKQGEILVIGAAERGANHLRRAGMVYTWFIVGVAFVCLFPTSAIHQSHQCSGAFLPGWCAGYFSCPSF
jgi:hypothetical protein